MLSLIYILLAVFSLTFLIFIHELAHYWMARRVGMRVETFSIGFGKPIFKWMKDGVQWQVGWLPFGGFVKIAGMDSETEDPYEIPDGFFGKTPWQRIKVLAIAPIVNILFALLVFTVLWASGGRVKNFIEYTPKIGWIEQKSELYQKGIRPGDEITSYNDQEFQGARHHFTVAMMSSGDISVEGNKIDYSANEKTPFSYSVKAISPQGAIDPGIKSTGIYPANYLIYDKYGGIVDNPIPEDSPMAESGIEYGDQLVWIDGERVFSSKHMSELLNDGRSLLKIQRGGQTQLIRVPRVKVGDLKISPEYKDEMIDWQYETNLNRKRLNNLYTLPYIITATNGVEKPISSFDSGVLDQSLSPGDQILSIDGKPMESAEDLLLALQERQVLVIVSRGADGKGSVTLQEANEGFEKAADPKDLQAIISTIGSKNPLKQSGDLVLLEPIAPKKRADLILSPASKALFQSEYEQIKKEIESIEDSEKRAQALQLLENRQNQLLLGLPGIQDKKVLYNPNPFELFADSFNQVGGTLKALVTGNFNPKWMSGPVGIVQVVHQQSMVSLKEMLFWVGFISLNLGILNLLPIPVLDGGSIVMALYEMITKKRIHPKTMEKLVIPFAILLISFFIFVTYHDLVRIIK